MQHFSYVESKPFQHVDSEEPILGALYRYRVLTLAEEAGIDLFEGRYFDDTVGAFKELQDRFYPDAWMFSVGKDQIPSASFRIVCANPAELALAYALRPDGISAEIVLERE